MNKQKISVISTVLNEEFGIRKFLDSIIAQTKKPNEVVIVDGGSKDNTFDILKEYSKKYNWIKAFQEKGANIAKGRNIAIRKSKGEIIFTSDSSTIFEEKWIEKIAREFKNDIDVVFGTYYTSPQGIIERFLSSRLPDWNKIDPEKFIPSNRNVAFRRIVWEKIGGFPENLRRADDNWFHDKAHEKRFNYFFVKDAQVQWIFNRNFRQMLKLAFLDSKTEGFSSLFLKRKIYLVEILLMVIFIFILEGIIFSGKINLLLPLLIIILIFSAIIGGYMGYRKTEDEVAALGGSFLIIPLYLAHVSGVITGMIQKIYKKNE